MNTIAIELEDVLNKFPKINGGSRIPYTINLVKLIKRAIKDRSSYECNETLRIIYESAMTAGKIYQEYEKYDDASYAFFIAGMSAATIYFDHCESYCAGKAVSALKKSIGMPYYNEGRIRKAQKTIKVLSRY